MKKLLSVSLAFILVCSFFLTDLYSQDAKLLGKWNGKFMDAFDLSIEFEEQKGGSITGHILMYDGSHQVQNDILTDIYQDEQELTFFIPNKDTRFAGVYDENGKTIKGEFIFPDGSKHPLLVYIEREVNDLHKISPSPDLTTILLDKYLSEDLNIIVGKFKEYHPDLYRFQDREAFTAFVNNLSDEPLNDETVIDFYLKVAPFVSSIGCSHSGIRLPESILQSLREKGNYFPIKMFFSDNKAYAISDIGGQEDIKPGSEILYINNLSIEQIIEQIFSLIPKEGLNKSTGYYEINRNFADYFVLIDNAKKFDVFYFDKDLKKKRIASVNSCGYAEIEPSIDLNMADNEWDFPVDFIIDQENSIAILNIPTFGIRDIGRYIGYMDSVFAVLNDTDVQNLIIDVRGNHGGHPIFAAQLFSYLSDNNFVYFNEKNRIEEFAPLYNSLPPNPIHFQGETYLLVNGGCLSTTGHLISLMRYHQTATIIGQEPGSSFRCNDKSKQFILPNSKLELNIPTTTFQTAVNGFTDQSSMLDIPVEIALSDVLNQKDTSLDKTRNMIEKKTSDNL